MNEQSTVLVVDADQPERETICLALEAEGLSVLATRNMYEALDRLDRLDIDAVVAPLKGDRIDGIAILEAAAQHNPDVGVIFLTLPNVLDTEVGIRAMSHSSASYFLHQPVNLTELKALLQKVFERRRLSQENRRLQSQIDDRIGLVQLTGHSQRIEEIRALIAQVAPTKATVMIRGERGTGKELVARAVHYRSLRRGSLVIFNGAAMNESLAESELFGHERGAFTGAYHRRKGRFEVAHGGTLFIDEVGHLSLSNQVRILRVLESKEFERVGGNESISVDVRVVCATNRDLEEAVMPGDFLPDLYDRLNVIQINLPPLRERREDIPLLVKVFMEAFCRENRKMTKSMTSRAMRTLMKYDWPGNVRELKNCIEGMVIMSNNSELDLDDAPEHILKAVGISAATIFSAPTVRRAGDPSDSSSALHVGPGMTLAEIEKQAIRATLRYTENNKAKAAKMLDISTRTIFRKIKEYSLCDE